MAHWRWKIQKLLVFNSTRSKNAATGVQPIEGKNTKKTEEDQNRIRVFRFTLTNYMSIALPCGWDKLVTAMANNEEKEGLGGKKRRVKTIGFRQRT